MGSGSIQGMKAYTPKLRPISSSGNVCGPAVSLGSEYFCAFNINTVDENLDLVTRVHIPGFPRTKFVNGLTIIGAVPGEFS
jgi:hypothetical protein